MYLHNVSKELWSLPLTETSCATCCKILRKCNKSLIPLKFSSWIGRLFWRSLLNWISFDLGSVGFWIATSQSFSLRSFETWMTSSPDHPHWDGDLNQVQTKKNLGKPHSRGRSRLEIISRTIKTRFQDKSGYTFSAKKQAHLVRGSSSIGESKTGSGPEADPHFPGGSISLTGLKFSVVSSCRWGRQSGSSGKSMCFCGCSTFFLKLRCDNVGLGNKELNDTFDEIPWTIRFLVERALPGPSSVNSSCLICGFNFRRRCAGTTFFAGTSDFVRPIVDSRTTIASSGEVSLPENKSWYGLGLRTFFFCFLI